MRLWYCQLIGFKTGMHVHACSVTLVMSDSVTLWTVACQTLLSMGFSRQEYWRGLSCPPPGVFPDPEIEPRSPALAGRFFTSEPPGKSLKTGILQRKWWIFHNDKRMNVLRYNNIKCVNTIRIKRSYNKGKNREIKAIMTAENNLTEKHIIAKIFILMPSSGNS